MTEIWSWLSALNDTQKFDLLKIAFEKLLLAGVLGIAGAIFAVLMERYKSALKKQEEISKIMIPEIKSMLEDAEGLFNAGVKALGVFEQQALSCQAWAKALCQSNARIETGERYQVPDDFRREIVRFEGSLISPMALLERTAPNDAARALLLNPRLAASSKDKLVGREFPGVLFVILNQTPESREAKGLALLLADTLFARLERAPHDAYKEKSNAFVLAMMRRLPTDNRRQKSAQQAIFEKLEAMRTVIDALPGSLLMDVGQLPPYRYLASAHAGIQSELRKFLRAV